MVKQWGNAFRYSKAVGKYSTTISKAVGKYSTHISKQWGNILLQQINKQEIHFGTQVVVGDTITRTHYSIAVSVHTHTDFMREITASHRAEVRRCNLVHVVA